MTSSVGRDDASGRSNNQIPIQLVRRYLSCGAEIGFASPAKLVRPYSLEVEDQSVRGQIHLCSLNTNAHSKRRIPWVENSRIGGLIPSPGTMVK
jgi:hypothetical protein